MNPNTYILLTALTISCLLGVVLGFWLCLTAMNRMMANDVVDVYRRGTRLVRFRMW